MSAVNPIADRRQRAREAYNDAIVEMYNDHDLGTSSRFELAIEVATQAKITSDLRLAIREAVRDAVSVALEAEDIDDITVAAFRAAGFEVVE